MLTNGYTWFYNIFITCISCNCWLSYVWHFYSWIHYVLIKLKHPLPLLYASQSVEVCVVLVTTGGLHFYHHFGGNIWHLSSYAWLIFLYRWIILYHVCKTHLHHPIGSWTLTLTPYLNHCVHKHGLLVISIEHWLIPLGICPRVVWADHMIDLLEFCE